MSFCVTLAIVLTILLQFRLIWAKDFSSGCNISLNVTTFNSTQNLTKYHVVIKENYIYLQYLHQNIALHPRSMENINIALSKEDLKSSLELREDKCINTKLLQQCTLVHGLSCNHSIVNAYNNVIQFCGFESRIHACSDENDSDNNECTEDDSAFLTYNIKNHSRFNRDFPIKLAYPNLPIRLICHSIYPHLVHSFKQIVFMNFVTSSSYQKQQKNLLYLTFADDFEKARKRKITYGICAFNADNALVILNNTQRHASEKGRDREFNLTLDGFARSINATGLLNDVLSTSIPFALLNFKFTDEEIIDYKVMPNFSDTKGQLYDVHFIATSSRKIHKGVTSSTVNASFVLICEFDKNIQQIEIWNRERLLIKTDSSVSSVQLSKCGLYNCLECFQVDDPFCGWDVTTATCIDISFANESIRASTKQGMYEKNPSKFCSSVVEFTQQEMLHNIDELKEDVANIRMTLNDFVNSLEKNNISENQTQIENKKSSIFIEYLRNISVGIQNQNELSHNISELLARFLALQNNLTITLQQYNNLTTTLQQDNNSYSYITLAIICTVTAISFNLITLALIWSIYKYCINKSTNTTGNENGTAPKDVTVEENNGRPKSHGNDHKDKENDENELHYENADTKSKEKLLEKDDSNKKPLSNKRYTEDPTEGIKKGKKNRNK